MLLPTKAPPIAPTPAPMSAPSPARAWDLEPISPPTAAPPSPPTTAPVPALLSHPAATKPPHNVRTIIPRIGCFINFMTKTLRLQLAFFNRLSAGNTRKLRFANPFRFRLAGHEVGEGV